MNVGTVANRSVVFTYPQARLNEAARLMREHHIGSLVVVEAPSQRPIPVGMLTDRDIVVAVIAKDLDPRTVAVGEVMSEDIATVSEQDSVRDALQLMRSKGVRRIPVVERDGSLAGIVSTDDLLDVVAGELDDIVRTIGSEKNREVRRRT